MNTKIFCDIAELDKIKKFNKKKIVKGFTTNPSLMRKAGDKDYKSYSKKILKIFGFKALFTYIEHRTFRSIVCKLKHNTGHRSLFSSF